MPGQCIKLLVSTNISAQHCFVLNSWKLQTTQTYNIVYRSRCSYLKTCWIKSGFISLNYNEMVCVPTGDHFKIPQLTQSQLLPWIKSNTLVSKSFVNIYLSLQLGGAKDENRTAQASSLLSCFVPCGAWAPLVHVWSRARCPELCELWAPGCTARLQRENTHAEPRSPCSPRAGQSPCSSSAFLHFCFLFMDFVIVIIILFLCYKCLMIHVCMPRALL